MSYRDNPAVICTAYFLILTFLAGLVSTQNKRAVKARLPAIYPVIFRRISAKIARSRLDTCTWVIPSFSAVAC